MYYNRTLSSDFSALIEPGGSLRWLFDFVKSRSDLDFQIGKSNSKEWISVYRGLSRVVSIHPNDGYSKISLNAAKKYETIANQQTLDIYRSKTTPFDFQKALEALLHTIDKKTEFDRYYNNKKEGFFQNELSRKYGILSGPGSNFVIIDKEAVIGYTDTLEKNKVFGPLQSKYKQLQATISSKNPIDYGKNLQKKAIGNELDFLALDREGNILLIEYKHGSNTSGIYLSPLQIGLYDNIFTEYYKNKTSEFVNAVYEMLEQKKKIGLIHPQWPTPLKINDIIPVLIISEYNYKSTAKDKFDEVLKILHTNLGNSLLNNLQKYNYTTTNGLSNW